MSRYQAKGRLSWHMHPSKAQISLYICAVLSESLWGAISVDNGSTFLQAENYDSRSDCADVITDLNLFCSRMPTCTLC